MTDVFDPRYPIGKQPKPTAISPAERDSAVQTIAELPEQLRAAVDGFDEAQLDTPYRDGGWTVRQLLHHVADSHTMALLRIKKALTEDWPEIFPYAEPKFAELEDYRGPAEWALEVIEATHARWVMLLESLDEQQWQRGYRHPERGPHSVSEATMIYAWHCQHHLAHITHLRNRKGW